MIVHAFLCGRITTTLPEVNIELRLFRFLIVTIANEGKLSLVFVPGQLLVLTFASKKRYRGSVGLWRHDINAVCFLLPGSDCEGQCLCIFAETIVHHVVESSFGAGRRISQDEIGAVFLFLFSRRG